MDDGASTISVTDLLDAYLDRQLNGVTTRLEPQLPPSLWSEDDGSNGRCGEAVVPVETATQTAACGDFGEADSDAEKLTDLKNRCQLLQSDVDAAQRFEHESADLLRKLEALKTKCRSVLQWTPPPSPTVVSDTRSTTTHSSATVRRGSATHRLEQLKHAVESELVTKRWRKYLTDADAASYLSQPSAEAMRRKYPHLFSHTHD